jgi:copper resistance protein B
MITRRIRRAPHWAYHATLIALLGLASAPLRSQEAATPTPVGVPVHEMLEDPFNRAIWIDELEGRDANGVTPLNWDVDFWAGRSLKRLTVRTEGERENGSTEHAELQLLWTRAFARWWDVVAGARADFAPGSDKNWAAFGVQGLAPYRFEVEATAFVSNGGDTAARFEAEYELLITNRLILQPQVELNWYGQSDVDRGYGTGLSSGEAALRLRYEVRREIAPYIGIVRERRWGDSADAARAAGFDSDDTSLVAGIRLRF